MAWSDYSKSPPAFTHLEIQQRIENSMWPRYAVNFRERDPIAVWVRIVWADDGEEWCAGLADRWNSTFVRVRFAYEELRSEQGLTWVLARNVRRRVAPPEEF